MSVIPRSSEKWCTECNASSIDTEGEMIGYSWHCYECAGVIHQGEKEGQNDE